MPKNKGMDEKIKSLRNLLLAFSFLFQMITCIVGLTIPIYASLLGATPLVVGIIGATGGALYSFMPAISGFLSDKFGRKTFIFLSTLLYGVSCLLYSLVENPYAFIPIKALESFSMALFWPSLEALLAEVSQGDLRGNLQKFNLSWGAAMMIGPMIGGFLISVSGVKAPLLVSSTLSITLLFIAAVKVYETRDRSIPEVDFKVLESGDKRPTPLSMAILSTFLLSFAAGIIFNIFPAYASSIGLPPHEIGLMIFFVGLFRLLAFLEVYRIENLIGRANVFFAGSILVALALALIAVSRSILLFSVSLSIFGFSVGLLYATSIASFLRSGGDRRGRAAGIFECLIGAGYFFGPLLGGVAAEFSPEVPYILTSLIAASANIIHFLFYYYRPKKA